MLKLARFRWRWIPFIATVLVAATGISLGQWQMRRAAEKEAIGQRVAERERLPAVPLDLSHAKSDHADDLLFRTVFVTGEFLRDWPVYLDNRPHNGVAGFYVLMPLKVTGSGLNVLVARGWVPRDPADRTKRPALITPSGEVRIAGRVVQGTGHVLQLGTASALQPGAILQNAGPADFAHDAHLPMPDFIIEQTDDRPAGGTPIRDGLVRDWPQPSAGRERNLGYAFQWYALAATAIIFFLVTGFRRGTNKSAP
jgi:surfeit locus 1 family protein